MIHRADLELLETSSSSVALLHGPVPTELDNFARAKLIVRTTLLMPARRRRSLGAEPVELELTGVPVA